MSASRLARSVFSRDPVVVARRFLALGLAFLFLGGAMALVIRWQLAFPGAAVPVVGAWLYPRSAGVVPPASYPSLFTMHGTIMIFFAVTPVLIGCLGNLLLPLQIGARRTAFPTLGALSLWTMFAASAVLVAGFFVPLGPAASGWTAYPPLSTTVGQPGAGQTLWLVAIILAGASTVMGAVNAVATVVRLRAPGMTFYRLPLTTWGLFLAAVLNGLFVPVLLAATLLLLLDRVAGTRFFLAGMSVAPGGGDPVLYQHLFWLFGHPEVYILILPVWGIVSDLLACFARKPAFGYRATARAMVAVTALSMVVYGHHMFTTTLSPLLSQAFMTLTMLISIPSSVFFLNWLGTLWRGALELRPPMLYALGVVWVFAVGGLTGVFLAAASTDVYLHDTHFVVGHFHFVMAAAVLLGAFAAVHFWFPRLTGRALGAPLAVAHFAGTFLPLNVAFGAMLLAGLGGMPRRVYDPNVYHYLRHLAPLNVVATWAALVAGAAQLAFLANVVWSLVAGPRAPANPWDATTLEWTDVVPARVHHGPHEYGHAAARGRGYVMQHEEAAP